MISTLVHLLLESPRPSRSFMGALPIQQQPRPPWAQSEQRPTPWENLPVPTGVAARMVQLSSCLHSRKSEELPSLSIPLLEAREILTSGHGKMNTTSTMDSVILSLPRMYS